MNTTAIKVPQTRNWIGRDEALKIIRNSAAVMKNSPRRKIPKPTIHDALRETALSGMSFGPSGEEAYQSTKEREAAAGILYQVLSKYPGAKKGDKYSKEIIMFALQQMALEGD